MKVNIEKRLKLKIFWVMLIFWRILPISGATTMTNEESVSRYIVKFDATKCPNCFASQHDIPICGSDGKTYQNPGTLNCAFKCNKKLKFVSYGPCPEVDPIEDQPKQQKIKT